MERCTPPSGLAGTPGSHSLIAKNTQICQTPYVFAAIFQIRNIRTVLLTVEEGDGVCADGVQSHRLFAVFGAAALVFLFPPEEGSAGRRRESLTGVFLHFCHAVSAVKLLVHPTPHIQKERFI